MTEYDVDFLISLIEERPVLWDTSDEHYKNKFIKQDVWKSVCESLFPNFQDKDNSEKTKLGNEVLKRWRGIDDTFKKYVTKLNDDKRSGTGAKPTKKYQLYKQLLNLKKCLQNATPDSIDETEMQPPPGQENLAISEQSPRRYKQQPRKRKTNELQNYILNILKEPENRHLSFFKGILPSLEKLDENKTLIFQSRVLQTLTDLLQPANQGYSPFSSSYQPSHYQSYTGYQTQHFAKQTPLTRPHLSHEHSSNAGEDLINSVEGARGGDGEPPITDTPTLPQQYIKKNMKLQNLKKAKETARQENWDDRLPAIAKETGEDEHALPDLSDSEDDELEYIKPKYDPWPSAGFRDALDSSVRSWYQAVGSGIESDRAHHLEDQDDVYLLAGEAEYEVQSGEVKKAVHALLRSNRKDVTVLGDRRVQVDLSFISDKGVRERTKYIIEFIIKQYTSIPGRVETIIVSGQGVYIFNVTNAYHSPDSDSSESNPPKSAPSTLGLSRKKVSPPTHIADLVDVLPNDY